MSDLPQRVCIHEEGPREGFQIASRPIETTQKIRFIEALAQTGVEQIDCVSYVNPKRVPGMADADEVARGIRKQPGVRYTGLWLNTRGLERALQLPLDLVGAVRVTASETFCQRNTGMGVDETFEEQRRWIRLYRQHGIEIKWAYVMTAFGCNFEGEVPVARVVQMVERLKQLEEQENIEFDGVYLCDTVGRGTPASIERRIGTLRERWPDMRIGLHLHDTRGTGMANAYAALRLGVDQFDTTCGGLGGCPFAGHKGASGNICTEDLVYMCHEMGIATGIDLKAMVECARMAEEIVGQPLPGKLMHTAF